MNLIILLFCTGILLLALEVVVPGAILGIVGGLALLGAIVASFVQFGADGGLTATAAALVIGGITLYLEFVYLPRSRLARVFSMTATVDGTSQPPIADRSAVLGRQATAVTTLAPSGYVELDGVRYEAFARSGLAAVGERLDVVDVDNFRLIVSKPATPAHS